jgi:Tol biopolymer transport system component
MPLTQGTRIGAYAVDALIGAGGMGEVYRARDTKLNRDVALKVLPPLVANDPDRLARFRREAQVLASLNDPHIAQIHGFEDSGETHALVMELVEGPTLAERIAATGPPEAERVSARPRDTNARPARGGGAPRGLNIDDALSIARQIATALDAAHQQGIVHRDLKPANVKVRDDGTVKVLDFGLAKALAPPGESSPDVANSPTITTPAMTAMGMILGTAAYMSPEQARGRPVDKRADIWAFGCVLYEMLTGRRAFSGEDVTETLASVVKEQPDLAIVPPVVRRALARCLEKDPRKRLRDIGDVWDLIDEPTPAAIAPPPRAWAGWWSWALAGALAVAIASAGTFAFLWQRARVPSLHAVEFELSAPEGTEFGAPGPRGTAVSSDGRAIVFVARTRSDASLWVRRLDSKTAWTLPGTTGALCPFWSPDSQSVAFVQDRKLRRSAIAGGAPQTLADVTGACFGGTWSRTGDVVLGSTVGLFSVSASGGALRSLLAPDAARHETYYSLPQFLPDGRHFLFYISSADESVRGTYVSSIDTPTNEVRIMPNRAGYVPPDDAHPGLLLWPRDQTLVAQPFDAGSLHLEGAPSPVADNVRVFEDGGPLPTSFWTSDAGVLAYRSGTFAQTSTLTWFDRTGHAAGTVGDPQSYGELALSPDGSRVAVFRRDTVGEDLWFIDIARGAAARLTTDPDNESYPVWSPDGTQVAFVSMRTGGGSFDLYRKPAGVFGEEEVLLKNEDLKKPLDWSRDGRYLLYDQQSVKSSDWDLWILPMGGDGKPAKYLATPFIEANARFSPDGRWVAYQSNQSARFEIYVSPFPDAAAAPAALVSTAGGTYPRWGRDGRALYYISAEGELMEVPVTLGTTVKAGTPVPLFKLPPPGSGLGRDPVGGWAWDVTADGRRFLINTAVDQQSVASLTIDTDWRAKLPR